MDLKLRSQSIMVMAFLTIPGLEPWLSPTSGSNSSLKSKVEPCSASTQRHTIDGCVARGKAVMNGLGQMSNGDLYETRSALWPSPGDISNLSRHHSDSVLAKLMNELTPFGFRLDQVVGTRIGSIRLVPCPIPRPRGRVSTARSSCRITQVMPAFFYQRVCGQSPMASSLSY